MKFLSLIKSLDFLGESLNFSINNQSCFQTVTGGSLSVIIYIIYFYFFYTFGLDFIYKQNPNVYSQIKSMNPETIPKINLTSEDFIFGIRFENLYGTPINYEEYLFEEISYVVDIHNKSKQTFEERTYLLEMISCDKFPKIKEKISNSIYDLKTFKCPDLSKLVNTTIHLGGHWEDSEVYFLRYELKFCKDAERKVCKRESDLIERLKKEDEVVISFIYPSIIFNADNYTKPFEYTFKNFFSYVSVGSSFRDEMFLGYNHLNQDAGIIFESNEDIREIGGLKVDSKNILRLKDNNGNIIKKDTNLYNMYVFFGREYLYHTRKYMKFQDLLANVGGFMELVLIILGFVYKIYNKFRLDAYLFNRLVFIKGDSKENQFDKDKIQQQKKELMIPIIIKKRFDNITSYSPYSNPPNSNKNNPDFNEFNKAYDKLSKENNKENLRPIAKQAENIELNNVSHKNDSIREGSQNISSNRILIGNNQEGTNIFNNKKTSSSNPIQIANFNCDENQNEMYSIEKGRVERIIGKMKKKKNNISFSFMYFCYQSFICCKNKDVNSFNYNLYKHLEKYSEKIYEKFDVFHYLKNVKIVKYMKKLLFEKEQTYILDKISEKYYGVNYSNISKPKEAKNDDCPKEKKLKLSIEKINESKSPNNRKFLEFISLLD